MGTFQTSSDGKSKLFPAFAATMQSCPAWTIGNSIYIHPINIHWFTVRTNRPIWPAFLFDKFQCLCFSLCHKKESPTPLRLYVIEAHSQQTDVGKLKRQYLLDEELAATMSSRIDCLCASIENSFAYLHTPVKLNLSDGETPKRGGYFKDFK